MELKYKIWDKEEKKMLVISFENEEDRYNKGKAILNYSTQHGLYATLSGYRDEDGNQYQLDAEILPSTGVKDINKKESYLGDILKGTAREEYGIVKKEEDNNNMYLEWNFKSALGELGKDKMPLESITNLNIVGNIYENQEMIKKK